MDNPESTAPEAAAKRKAPAKAPAGATTSPDATTSAAASPAGAAPPATPTAPEAASVPLRPRWDDSALQSAYANVCNVVGSREEIALLFGTNQAWQSGAAGPAALDVKLSQRIVLTPYTAKRLAQMLVQGVREYEQRFGEIKLT